MSSDGDTGCAGTGSRSPGDWSLVAVCGGAESGDSGCEDVGAGLSVKDNSGEGKDRGELGCEDGCIDESRVAGELGSAATVGAELSLEVDPGEVKGSGELGRDVDCVGEAGVSEGAGSAAIVGAGLFVEVDPGGGKESGELGCDGGCIDGAGSAAIVGAGGLPVDVSGARDSIGRVGFLYQETGNAMRRKMVLASKMTARTRNSSALPPMFFFCNGARITSIRWLYHSRGCSCHKGGVLVPARTSA